MIEVKQIDIENDIPENAKVWRSCCFRLDGHCIAYTGQFIFTMSVRFLQCNVGKG